MARYIIHLKPSLLSLFDPVFRYVQVPIQHIYTLALDLQPSPTVNQPSPLTWLSYIASIAQRSHIVGVDFSAII
jgi:hypothetical protein